VTCLQRSLFIPERQHQFSAQNVNEFDTLVLVRKEFAARSCREDSNVSVDLTLDRVEVEALEKDLGIFRSWANRKSLALLLVHYGESVAAAVIHEKIFKAHAEDERHPEQRWQSRKESSAFNLGKERGRQPRMPAELDQSHLLSKTQFPNLFANRVAAKA